MPKKSNRTWHRNTANKPPSKDSHASNNDDKERRSRGKWLLLRRSNHLFWLLFSAELFPEFDGRFDQRNGSRSGNYRPRVSFKAQTRPQGRQIAKSMILKHLGDGDVLMNGDNDDRNSAAEPRRPRDQFRKRNSPLIRDNRPSDGRSRGPMRYNEFNWYRVTVRIDSPKIWGNRNNIHSFFYQFPHGSKYTKDYVISTLLNLIKPIQFVPIMVRRNRLLMAGKDLLHMGFSFLVQSDWAECCIFCWRLQSH